MTVPDSSSANAGKNAYSIGPPASPRLIRFKGRWQRMVVGAEIIWVNPDDIGVLCETSHPSETYVALRSAVGGRRDARGFWVSAPVDAVAEHINGGDR